MAQKLTGKVAVVTGAGSEVGMGKEIAIAMAAEGAKVVVNDIAKDKEGNWAADRVVSLIKKARGTAVANYDSVASMAGGQNMINTAMSNFGRIDILVNTAGNFARSPLVDITEEFWDSIINVHLKGHFICIQAAAREMIKQKSGRVVNFSSRGAFHFPGGVGQTVVGGSPPYSAAKAGILGLTAWLAAELGQYGITVNAIVPSADTMLFPGRGPKWFGGGAKEGPEYVAPVVAYLATDEAKDINGQFIYACGGDIVVFNRPMQLPGPHMFVRKMGKWTIDELNEVIPPLVLKK